MITIDKDKFFEEKMKRIDEEFDKVTEKFSIDLSEDSNFKTVLKGIFSAGFSAGMLDGANEMKRDIIEILNKP